MQGMVLELPAIMAPSTEYSWIVFKKVTRDFKEFILTLAVHYNAEMTDATSGMLRADSAVVLKAETLAGDPVPHETFYSMYDWKFEYRVGRPVVSPLDKTKGIYCFTDKAQARMYMSR